jgi:hypothetical protein
MIAIGGDEDEQRRLHLHQALDHREAIEAGHLDVEEDEVRLVGLDARIASRPFEQVSTISTSSCGSSRSPQPLDRQGLIVDQDRTDTHFDSSGASAE